MTCQCKNRAACNPVDGTCTCTAGYAGAICDTSKYLQPFNGIQCMHCFICGYSSLFRYNISICLLHGVLVCRRCFLK